MSQESEWIKGVNECLLTSSVVQSRSHRPSAKGLVAESGVGLAVTDRGRRA
jgi:hypothetical protein